MFNWSKKQKLHCVKFLHNAIFRCSILIPYTNSLSKSRKTIGLVYN